MASRPLSTAGVVQPSSSSIPAATSRFTGLSSTKRIRAAVFAAADATPCDRPVLGESSAGFRGHHAAQTLKSCARRSGFGSIGGEQVRPFSVSS